MCFPFSLEKKLPPPKSTEEIDAQGLFLILRQRLPYEGEIYLSDRTYRLCNLEDIRVFCKQDQTNHQKFQAEYYDCDDFSYRLMGQLSIPEWSALAFGLCWTDTHALNCFVDEAKHFYFLEPQTDTIQTELDFWQGTRLRFICM